MELAYAVLFDLKCDLFLLPWSFNCSSSLEITCSFGLHNSPVESQAIERLNLSYINGIASSGIGSGETG